jgi:hypothetical protein
MSLLIDQSGKIYENDSLVNQHLFPVQIGKFRVSEDAKRFIANDLNESNADQLFQYIPQ